MKADTKADTGLAFRFFKLNILAAENFRERNRIPEFTNSFRLSENSSWTS